MKIKTLLVGSTLLLYSCQKNEPIPESRHIPFGVPQRVTILGYNDHAMEPFLSQDGNTLFFNNSNHPGENTNIHFATRVDNLTFKYQDELNGVNSEHLDGVPTMDTDGIFYFVSTRNYFDTYATIYSGTYADGAVTNIQIVPGVSKNQIGWLNFDVEVSSDGNHLFITDGRFDDNGGPHEANLVVAHKSELGNFVRLSDQSILKYINTQDLEYAACISNDMRELFFTRVEAPITAGSIPSIWVATREDTSLPFGKPYMVDAISGFVEAATISSDGKRVYYHKLENDTFVLYVVEKL